MNRLFQYALFIIALLVVSCSTPERKTNIITTPDHLVMIVFDSLRPDFIDRFDMPNLRKLRDRSRSHTQSYVGYVGAETVVSHLVISTGLRPKDLAYQDDVFFDKKGLLGEAGGFYNSGGLNFKQLTTLMGHLPAKQFLPQRLKDHTGGTVFSISQKSYAAMTFGTPAADSIITMKKTNGKCTPDGINVPQYVVAAPEDRFNLDCSKKYGTESTYYPYDGARFVPGDDPKHIGGDPWVTDVAKEVMRNEVNWRGLFLSYGAIDKVSHMLGEHEGKRPKEVESVKTEYTLAKIAKIADDQLGIIVDELEKANLANRTIIVVTSDHGGHPNYHYLGNGQTSKWGKLLNDAPKPHAKWVGHFSEGSGVKFSIQDSFIRTWLKPDADANRVIRSMSEVPGVVEIYKLTNEAGKWKYQRKFSVLEKQPATFQKWAKAHNEELLAAYATERAPDIIGLLADNTGFDLIGDHGGAQEKVQRVPIIIFEPGKKGSVVATPMRLFDVNGVVSKAMELPDPPRQ